LALWRKSLWLYALLFGAAALSLFFLSMIAWRRAGDAQEAVQRWQETTQKLSESQENLQKTAQRLQLAITSGRLGIWELNIKTDSLKGYRVSVRAS
jgi:hypothetical protein